MPGDVEKYGLCAVITVMVYLLNARSGVAVGEARNKYRIPMPRTQGSADFERIFRAHANNAEQYPQFLALMWTFAYFVHGNLAGVLGAFWIIMRHLYVSEYHREADKVQRYTIPAYLVFSIYSIGILFTVLHDAVVKYL